MGNVDVTNSSRVSSNQPVIIAQGLRKSFGTVTALDGVDLAVHSGTVMALLGPNGSGKTTFIRIFTTLSQPDAGKAIISGHDVVGEPAAVRSLIGLAGQYPAVDEILTGQENLEMVGRLYHLGRVEARLRASELLEQFGLADVAKRRVRTYSGGMRRRLDLAASLVASPAILFLDEPTTGLDPASRLSLWGAIRNLVQDGTTVFLTTQYLEEADRLADRIAVLDTGRVIREGTSRELKACCGGDVHIQIHVADLRQTATATELLGGLVPDGTIRTDLETGEISLPAAGGTAMLSEIVRALDAGGVALSDVSLQQPTLDDVFLRLTGRTARECEKGVSGKSCSPG